VYETAARIGELLDLMLWQADTCSKPDPSESIFEEKLKENGEGGNEKAYDEKFGWH
jgi:hypothetical protein